MHIQLGGTAELKLHCLHFEAVESEFSRAFLLTSEQTHWGTRCNPLPHHQTSCLDCFPSTRQLMHEKALASLYSWHNKCTRSLCVADQSKNCILKAQMWSEDRVSPHQAEAEYYNIWKLTLKALQQSPGVSGMKMSRNEILESSHYRDSTL